MDYLNLVLYAVITAVVVTVEHYTLGRWWKRNEIARRTVGHTTILLLAAPFVPTGLIDLNTLIAITIATGTAGAIVGGIHVYEVEKRKNEEVAKKREVIKQYDQITRL